MRRIYEQASFLASPELSTRILSMAFKTVGYLAKSADKVYTLELQWVAQNFGTDIFVAPF